MIGALLVLWLLLDVALVLLLVYGRERHEHRWSLIGTPTRLYLHCLDCHFDSPGWSLFDTPPGCERFARRSA